MPVSKMTISFHANCVTYGEAIGGDLVQAHFIENDDDAYDEDEIFDSKSKCFLVSMLYEFPHETPSIEWHDGSEADGGANILRLTMSKGFLRVWLDNGVDLKISFDGNVQVYEQIHSFFARHFQL